MNKKTFLSILLSGKLGLSLISGLKVIPSSASPITADQCADQPFNIIMQSTQPGLEYISDPYGNPTINVFIPGTGCTYVAPDRINLVITGVNAKDEVYIGLSTTKDDPDFLSQTQNKLRLGRDLTLLAWFSITNVVPETPSIPGIQPGLTLSVDSQNSGACLVVPIILPQDLYSILGGEFYIQAISFPNNNYTWDSVRASDLVKIRVDVETCSVY